MKAHWHLGMSSSTHLKWGSVETEKGAHLYTDIDATELYKNRMHKDYMFSPSNLPIPVC